MITFNGEEHVAADLDAALALVGDVRGIEIVADKVGDRLKLSKTRIQARFEIDVDAFPPPLRVELLSELAWDFSTGWKEWLSAGLVKAGR